ncbi:SdrD B-like domain-containing protein, partial [Fibrisoma limi]|uniref:SdrD B-like domain-containing protein n=1 Tax=Fibrisoma limi TaxID=663275 RepID=UPI0011819629
PHGLHGHGGQLGQRCHGTQTLTPITGRSGSYTLAANESNLTVDAGFFRPASLGDKVFVDANRDGLQQPSETGLASVTVTLVSNGTVVASVVTGADGVYSFTGLTPGVPYSVSFTAPQNYTASVADQGGDDTLDSDPVNGITQSVTLASGQTNTSVDAGFSLLTASLGDLVFEDTNANGQQDAGEAGIAGVSVQLLANGSVTPVASTTTNASGVYSFTGLTPGVSYTVVFATPTGYTATVANVGNDATDSDADPVTGRSGSYTLAANESNLTVDAGFFRPASLGDKVFVDANRDGLQQPSETGLASVTVTLVSNGTVVASVVTGADGVYSFTGLTPGVPYSVSFTAPQNYTASVADQGGDDTLDSDPVNGITQSVTLASGQTNTSVDAGFSLLTASLGDLVFEDTNANGQQDAGEAGIAGVSVQLLANGSVTPVASTTTNASGVYSFTGLTPGVSYTVVFATPTGYTATVANVGNDATDSDADPITGRSGSYTLAANESNLTVDAGFFRPASLGDKVFVDANRNGLQDAAETGL